MEVIESLAKKVRQAAEELTQLKRERIHLNSELEYLRKQNNDYQMALRENERLKRDQARLRVKLDRLNKKIDKYLALELQSAVALNGGNHEEHPE